MLESPVISPIEIIRYVVASVEPPCWDLAPSSLVLEEGVGVFLYNPDTTPPVMAAKVRAQAIPCAGGPWAVGEGSGVLLSQPREAHVVHLRLVFRLTDQQPAPVDFWFHHVHTPTVFRH